MQEDYAIGPTPDRIKQLLQEAILRDYPNPERKGCFDSAILTTIAQQRLPYEDPHWAHVSHCSPCYAEFLGLRKRFREKRSAVRRFQFLLWTAVVIMVVFLLGLSAITFLRAH